MLLDELGVRHVGLKCSPMSETCAFHLQGDEKTSNGHGRNEEIPYIWGCLVGRHIR